MFHELTFRAMNADIQVLLESPASLSQLETPIMETFGSAEQRFSRFLSTSECSYLNERSGQLCFVSKEMLEVLEAANYYQALTNGIFNIGIGHALRQAGYSQSFEKMKTTEWDLQVPNKQFDSRDHENSLRVMRNQSLEINARMRSICIPKGVQLDFGGIVKSWTVHQAASQLRQNEQVPRGLIHAGGDVEVWGGSSEQDPWIVGIAHPFLTKPAQEACVHLISGGVATSSTGRRRWVTRDGEMHHLIDTRSMRPSESDVVQCTVVGPDIVGCEVWAKVLCMLGLEEGVALFRQRSQGMEALLYTTHGNVYKVNQQMTTGVLHWSGLDGVIEL